jgi:hypothetical protein
MFFTFALWRRESSRTLPFLALGNLNSSRPSRTDDLVLPARVTRLDLFKHKNTDPKLLDNSPRH